MIAGLVFAGRQAIPSLAGCRAAHFSEPESSGITTRSSDSVRG